MAVERDVWAPLFKLLPPMTQLQNMDGWVGEWVEDQLAMATILDQIDFKMFTVMNDQWFISEFHWNLCRGYQYSIFSLLSYHIDSIKQTFRADTLSDEGTELLQLHQWLQTFCCAVWHNPVKVTICKRKASLMHTTWNSWAINADSNCQNLWKSVKTVREGHQTWMLHGYFIHCYQILMAFDRIHIVSLNEVGWSYHLLGMESVHTSQCSDPGTNWYMRIVIHIVQYLYCWYHLHTHLGLWKPTPGEVLDSVLLRGFHRRETSD